MLLWSCMFVALSATAQRYQISTVKTTEVQDGVSSKNTFIGVFSPKGDTAVLYSSTDGERGPKRAFYYSGTDSNSTRLTVVEESEILATLQIKFLQNSVLVDSDRYELEASYAATLRTQILIQKSVLALAGLLKEQLGDYAEALRPLMKTWIQPKEKIPAGKIRIAHIVNRNYQTDTAYHRWKAVYRYNKRGVLGAIKGGEVYDLKLVRNTSKFSEYEINIHQDRYFDKSTLYRLKASGFDSSLSERRQLATDQVRNYKNYQTALKSERAATRPSEDALLLLLSLKEE